MKRIETIIYTSLIAYSFCNAQIDTTDWFPMQTGNYWEYMAITIEGPKYFSQKIVGDTLMPNGKTYKIISEEYFEPYFSQDYRYFRKDTNIVYKNNGGENEYKYVDFVLSDSSVWILFPADCCNPNARGILITFYDFNYYNFLNKPNEAKQFEDVFVGSTDTIWTPTDSSFPIVLNKGLGIVWHFRFNDGSYYLQGAIINGVKMGVITKVLVEELLNPKDYNLKTYPNPFNSTTNIVVDLPNSGFSELSIYNLLGQKVITLFNEYKLAGNYNLKYSADHLSSGLYIIVLKQNKIILKDKIILLK